MTPDDTQRVVAFIDKWQKSGGNERANYQGFFLDLCAALGVEGPPPKGNIADDPYCFDKDIKVYHPSGNVTPGYIDFYKADHFIIEAKQGSDITGKGTAKRGTPTYLKAMERAFVQAIAYTRNVSIKPPFLLTCDIGDHFELWTGFNGDYGGYAARQDVELTALQREEVFDLFVDIFTNPQARNPEKIAARVTREVAADLAELTRSLERLPARSPSPLTPLPMGEGNQSDLPSPDGRRAGDEGNAAAIISPSLLPPLSMGEGDPDLPSPAGRRAGDEGQAAAMSSPSPLTPLPMGEGDPDLSSTTRRRARDEGQWDGEFSRLAGRWRQIPDEYIERARDLRRNQTPAETLLWELLRAKRFLGAKFRRQHKIGQFIADFYCHDARLVIELDGAVHDQQSFRDQDRDQWMQANGITVLRFDNAEVFDNTEAVLSAIAEVISPSPLTPLPMGEGNPDLPSPAGRRAGDEEQAAAMISPSPLTPRPLGEGNRSDLPSPAGRRAGDEGQAAAMISPSPLTPRPMGEGNRSDLSSPAGRRAGDEGYNHAQAVAHFLMRCIFTMFAEDVGLLKERLFTEALKTRWQENPQSFRPEVENLWQAMNEGGTFGFHGRLLRFNGGLFAEPVAFDLSADQVKILLAAAERDWQNVEPAIFGTLLERALDTKERSKLGAHYTPRSYVERLVKPVVMEPLQAQWVVVQGEAKQQLGDDPTPAQKKKAIATLEAFLTELRETRILDPACGTGNFLYVTLDLIKQLESEVLKRLEDITGQAQLRLDIDQVNPSQFLGIEINPRAAAIADLVIWIGYLQWHFRRFGDLPPVEPVLREYHNIECRDAVLAYDGKEPDVDPATGQVRTRWGGRKMRHPVTGEEVPDPSDQIPIYRYLNPRPAEWPEADYVVSNPPFIGNARMREALGDGYAKVIRDTYREVPESVDFVTYWWHKSALLAQQDRIQAFGFITTNSLRQTFNRKVIQSHLQSKKPISIKFAVPDHPWVDSFDGADVRISMTAAISGEHQGNLLEVIEESSREAGESELKFEKNSGKISADLNIGADVTLARPLKANEKIGNRGVQLIGSGFMVTLAEAKSLGLGSIPGIGKYIRRYRNGRDLTSTPRNMMVIDLFGLTEKEVKTQLPSIYQWILERVKPEREQNNRKSYREKWWIFGEPVVTTRNAIEGLKRYIVTCRTAKHRVFAFLESDIVPDAKLVTIGLEDSCYLGILSSNIHVCWAMRSGAWLGVGNDSNYNHSECFSKFPFPDPTPEQKQKIRDLGERLDAHRKQVQAAHPDITITGMYNLLEKLRAGQPFTDADRDYNNRALVSTLKQIHDDLDLAVLDAYGWPHTITDEQILENLVALNAQRAEEERNGHIRWLRPEYQSPLSSGRGAGGEGSEGEGQQTSIPGIADPEATVIAPVEQQTFPSTFKDQLAAICDLMRTQGGEWTVAQVKAQFKNASRKQKAIQDCLDSLTELGVIAVHTEAGSPRWYIAALQKAS